jgi:phosphoribosylaminoimidazole-succinocarboxamide synthase
MKLMAESPIKDYPLLARGKVRDIYDLGDKLLLLATDRVSAFDVVLDGLIPDKGGILTSISAFWFRKLEELVPNHMLSTDPTEYPEPFSNYAEDLAKRSMLVKKLEMLPCECIVRGYLEGSALKSYQKDGTVNGVKLPAGLVRGDKLPEPLFTPSTKAEVGGHDINISVKELADIIGSEMAKQLEETSLKLFAAATEHAEANGLILADTKFEYGLDDGVLTLGDEAFTPDSSRFWDKELWEPGKEQASFDKQFLREWLSSLDWDKTPPGPTLPQDIIDKTAARYREAWLRLTGSPWEA